MPDNRLELMIENAELFGGQYMNFQGNPTPFNPQGGVRTFAVAITKDGQVDERLAQELLRDGWNIKYTNPREEGDVAKPFVIVTVGFKFPPHIVLITSKARTYITEETIDTLAWTNMKTVDVIINGGKWTDDHGATKVKAWLKTMYVTVDEDPLMLKYADANFEVQ